MNKKQQKETGSRPVSTDSEVGERLVSVRKALNKKQQDFAVEMGFSSGNGLSMVELGKTPLQSVYYKLLNLAFNVNPEWLKYGTGEMFNTPVRNEKEDFSNDSDIRILTKEEIISKLIMQNDKLIDSVKMQSITIEKHVLIIQSLSGRSIEIGGSEPKKARGGIAL